MVESNSVPSISYPRLGDWEVRSTIGRGNVKVKLGVNVKTGKEAAIKIFKFVLQDDGSYKFKKRVVENKVLKSIFYDRKDIINELSHEASIMERLNHPNIITFYELHESIEYIKSSGKKINVAAIIMELAKKGELFSYLDSSGKFTEKLSRFYFHQIINALEYCHTNKIAHRDLKPANLVFDENFNLKIIDFGFAISWSDEGSTFKKSLGTLEYMAPELILNEYYDARAVDLFAVAVILFNMVTGVAPFKSASPSNPHYKCLMNGDYKRYWSLFDPKNEQSLEFKELMQIMLRRDPKDRLSIEGIKSHPWFNGSIESPEDVQKELQKRLARFQESRIKQENQRIQQKQKERELKSDSTYVPSDQSYRSSEEIELEEKMKNLKISFDTTIKRTIKDFESIRTPASQFMLGMDPNTALKHVIIIAKQHFSEFAVSSKEYKVKGVILSERILEVAVVISRVDEFIVCVEFQRILGNPLEFYEVIRDKFKSIFDELGAF